MASNLILDAAGDHTVRWCRTDAIAIGDEELRASFAVMSTGILRDWPATTVDDLVEQHIDLLLAARPDLILIGVGETQRQLPPALAYRALSQGIGIEVMTNAAAARTYNLLLADDRNVLAAFILPGR